MVAYWAQKNPIRAKLIQMEFESQFTMCVFDFLFATHTFSNTFLSCFLEAPNSSFYPNVVFCRNFHQTPFCKRYIKQTLLLVQFWASCSMMHKENPPLTLSLKTKIRNIKVLQVEAIPTIFQFLKCMKA